MNSDTAELPILERAGELAVALEPRAGARMRARSLPAWLRRLRADPARMAALRDSAGALWRSRLLVWGAAVATILAFGFGPSRGALNPPGLTRGLGRLGDLLAAPAARWDGAWYLVIAHYGYRPDLGVYTAPRTAFFPLYPLGVRGVSWLGVPAVLAGVLLSLAALAAALYGIHRLTTLELGRVGSSEAQAAQSARLAVLLLAFAPMAFFLSAVYSESLYLALSVGLFWSARHGRWKFVGLLGAAAAATRSSGLVLALPALMIYLYGPREDRAPDVARSVPARGTLAALRPRYRPRRDILWLALLPAGIVLYGAYLAAGGGDPLAPLHAQDVWGRHFAGPYMGVWDGVTAAFDGARQLLSPGAHVYFHAPGSATIAAEHNLVLFAFLALALLALIGALRRLPLAYGAYALAALALPLSDPVSAQPLMSLPRFLLVLFPLTIWQADWLVAHPRARRAALALSAALLAVFAAQFATWHWVA